MFLLPEFSYSLLSSVFLGVGLWLGFIFSDYYCKTFSCYFGTYNKKHRKDANWDVSSVMKPKLMGVSGLCNIIPLKRAQVTQPGLIKSRLTSQ